MSFVSKIVPKRRRAPAPSRQEAGVLQRRLLPLVIVVEVAAAFIIALGAVFAKPLLFLEGGRHQADVIVILGGDPGNRVFRALELYKAGAASKILISGRGDCFVNRDHLLLAGVSSNALILEPESRNTMENAEFSARMMQARGMKSAILVTSWYHSRRALACFSHFGAAMDFSSLPTYDGPDMKHRPSQYELQRVLREYAALLWYGLRYGIFPTGRLAAS